MAQASALCPISPLSFPLSPSRHPILRCTVREIMRQDGSSHPRQAEAASRYAHIASRSLATPPHPSSPFSAFSPQPPPRSRGDSATGLTLPVSCPRLLPPARLSPGASFRICVAPGYGSFTNCKPVVFVLWSLAIFIAPPCAGIVVLGAGMLLCCWLSRRARKAERNYLEEVGGSGLVKLCAHSLAGGLAQLGERCSNKETVNGSIPLCTISF